MKEQKTPQEKQLTMMKVQTLLVLLILILIALFVFFLIGKVNTAMAFVEQVDVDALNGAVTSLTAAADTLSKVDTESLNAGIRDLSSAAEGLGQLDFQKLGKFMDSLEVFSQQMDGISSFFSKFLK